MVLKAFLLFVLAVTQVLATSVLQLRSLQIIESRQAGCTVCTTVQTTINGCASSDLGCQCTPTIASQVQDCVNCLYTTNPTQSQIASAQSFASAFASLCSGTSGVPKVTTPPTPSTLGSSVPTSSPVTGTTSTSAAASASSSPTKSGAGKGRQAGLAAIGASAMLGAVFVL